MVSVRITSTTISMEMMAAASKVGAPRWNGAGKATIGPSPTFEKSAMPVTTATPVPASMASRMDRREIVALPTLLSRSTRARVIAASPMLATLP
ncbi:hypothetical protein SRABI128_06521 [Microbacterium sp. Bi128]|nr:hypothetical protein SRABI128_06521 [Microbacterium sp. Bi128]